MPSEDPPLVYLILGPTGSDRRAIVADLIDGGLSEQDRPVVLLSSDEPASEHDGRLRELQRWSWQDGTISAPDDALAGATHVFFITDGRRNPVDQIEAFKPWMDSRGGEIGAVLCSVQCQLAEAHKELLAWYDACIHFADVVLLARREGVANKWLSDFQGRYEDKFYPCLFEFVKGGRVKNPALVLDPQPRRISHFFDEAEWLVDGKNIDDVESGEGDGDEPGELEEEVEVTQAEDPYMERRAGGRRVKEIPDIAKFLSA